MNSTEYINPNELDSEAYVLKLENEENTWNDTYGIHVNEILNEINCLLSENSSNSLRQLIDIFHSKDFIANYQSYPTIAYMIIMVTIYEDEVNNETNEFQHIFNNIHCVDMAIEHYNTIKFLLYNVEFDVGRQAAIYEIVNSVFTKQLSITALTYILQGTSINKAYVFNIIIDSLANCKMIKEAARLKINMNLIVKEI